MGSGGREMSCATTRAGGETTEHVCVRLSPLEVCASSAAQTSKSVLTAVKSPNVPKSSVLARFVTFFFISFLLGHIFPSVCPCGSACYQML